MKKENITYILENIISKAKYNELTGKYEIKEIDYIDFNLSTNKMKLLKKICENIGIDLEYKGYTKMLLPCIENEELFKKYNTIKSQLELNPTSSKLEEQRIEIRNKIAIDNIEFVESILNRRIDGLNDIADKEDINQLGYEVLIEYIDNNYLYVGSFKDHVSKLLLLNVSRRLIAINEGIGYRTKEYIENIARTKEIISTKQLSEELKIKEKKAESLIALDNILSAISLEELIEQLEDSNELLESVLFDDSFEQRMIDRYSQRTTILKILSTLSQREKEIIILYFGLNNGVEYTQQEIATMYGISKKRISAIIIATLQKIRSSVRVNYLKEVYDVPSEYQEIIDYSENKALEELLIIKLPRNIYEMVYSKLGTIEQKKLFNYMYQNPQYDTKSLSQVINKSLSNTHVIKSKIIFKIRKIIMSYIKEEGHISYEEYLDYLIYVSLNQDKIKKRGK